MRSIGKIASEKIKSNATDTVMMKFGKKNIMVDGVEGFGQIKENSNSVMVEVKGGRNFIVDVQKSKISGVMLAKSILVVIKNIEASEEVIKPIIDKAFKDFRKTWKQ